jgi:hypothetical protein
MFAIIWLSGPAQISGELFFSTLIQANNMKYRPATAEELFNLRHASARNVIERIFGVIKRRFRILVIPPEYDMRTQARLPAALGALHNFIRNNDPAEMDDLDDDDENEDRHELHPSISTGDLADGAPGRTERREADNRRDNIAKAMWEDYRREIRRRERA